MSATAAALLITTFYHFCPGSGQSVQPAAEVVPEVAPPLSCYDCHSKQHDNCEYFNQSDIPETKACGVEHKFCVVLRHEMTGKLVYTKRNCSHACSPGCVKAGDLQRVSFCFSCCQHDLCNVGSGAPGPRLSAPPFLAASSALAAIAVLAALEAG